MNDSKKSSDTRERHKHSKKHKHHRSRSRERHRKHDSKSDSYSQTQAASVPSTSRSLNQERLPESHRSLDDERHEGYFDFTKHKYSLNKIFFRDQGLIKRLLIKVLAFEKSWRLFSPITVCILSQCRTEGGGGGGGGTVPAPKRLEDMS